MFPDERLEARPAYVAHREVENAVDLVRLVDRDHVRMVDRGSELRFAEEPSAERLVAREFGRDHLEGDLAAEALVGGEVDRAHSAPPERRLDAISAERVARARGQHVRSRYPRRRSFSIRCSAP